MAAPSHSHSRSGSLASGITAAKEPPAGPSAWARLRGCFRRGRAGGGRMSASEPRHSMTSQPPPHATTTEQVLAENQLRKQIEKYSTMRVHMKRVQLCLEQEKRNKFYKELLVYVVFLALVMGSLLSLPIHFPYEQNAALEDLFFDEEFRNISIRKSFHDVMIEEELWQWVDGPFVEGYYELPIRNTRRIGSVLVRTGRVRGDLCRQTHGRTDFVLFTDEFCYPEFSTAAENREPYGGDDVAAVLGEGRQYEWSRDHAVLYRSQTFTPSLINHDMDYGRGGYGVYLPRDNITAARTIIRQLKKDFLTDSSRYFAVTFAFYNARSDIFTHVQALFELSDTDYMETTARIKSFRILSSYKDPGFFWDNIFVFVVTIAAVWLTYRELADLREYGLRKYIHSLWNLLDMLQLVLLVIFIEKWVSYLVQCERIRDDLVRVAQRDCAGPAGDQGAAKECYVDVEHLAWLFLSVTNFAAALALVSVAIVFKYLRLNTRLNLLWRTLRFAAKDLLAFVVIFFVIFFAFAVMGFLTFGSKVRQYHSLSVSLTSCFQMLLGAFDYNEIYKANPAMAGLFFFSFMISVYLICVNMFIAIMSEYYSLAQAEKKKYEESKKNLLEVTRAAAAAAAAKDPRATLGRGAPSSRRLQAQQQQSQEFSESLQLTDVEYDLAKQLENYLHGLRVRVRLPPTKDEASLYGTDQVLLTGYQRVLLVDYDYLMAERRRLRTKLRAYVHVVATCAYVIRRTRPDFKMAVTPRLLVDNRPRASSSSGASSSFADLADFPVTYIPISSVHANTVEILAGLKKGMFVDMDDGSLTKDQITLEVLGGQDEYVPPRYRRRDDVALAVTTSEQPRRISEATDDDDNDDHGPDQHHAPTAFGLRHHHEGIGGPGHIRCCRVLYNGDTVLDGLETCLLPRRVWVVYVLRHMLWGSLVGALRRLGQRKKATPRLVNDAEVDRLIREHFVAPGRGISCRFDELVRNFRMFIAKKVHRKNWRIPNLEERIYAEVITFLERFPSALSPLDKRELEGYKYTPQPVDTSRVRLPNSIHLLAELLAQNAHEVWGVGRIEQGWRWGATRDNDRRLHPDLIPYEELTEETKQYDRDTSIEALKVITALGYVLEPPAHAEDMEIAFGVPAAEPGGTYEPRPIPTDSVKVPPELRSLIELLAENTHEVWAKMRMEQGWRYGPRRDDAKKEHNGLVPYIYLTQEEKQMDRNTAMQSVKVILRCGFTFVHKDKLTSGSGRAQRKKHSGGASMRVFGRSENAETRNVGDAVALARGTARAKRAFLKRGGQSSRGLTNRTSLASSSLGSQMSLISEDDGDEARALESSGASASGASEPHEPPPQLQHQRGGRLLQHSETAPEPTPPPPPPPPPPPLDQQQEAAGAAYGRSASAL